MNRLVLKSQKGHNSQILLYIKEQIISISTLCFLKFTLNKMKYGKKELKSYNI